MWRAATIAFSDARDTFTDVGHPDRGLSYPAQRPRHTGPIQSQMLHKRQLGMLPSLPIEYERQCQIANASTLSTMGATEASGSFLRCCYEQRPKID